MDELADGFAGEGVSSVFVYTREAHPGEHHRHHTSMDDKRTNARAFREHARVRRRILLDDLEGTAHRAWGSLPNMTWIVGRGGVIHYKADWTDAADVRDALRGALRAAERRRSEPLRSLHTERLAWRVSDGEAFRRGLERAGPQAVADFYGKK